MKKKMIERRIYSTNKRKEEKIMIVIKEEKK
jgi:hypothetical protein